MTAELIHILQEVRAAVPHIDWQKLYEAAMLEMNPDKLAICIGAAEQAIAQRESLVDIAELERGKMSDARSMLKSLSRIASSQGKHAAYEAASQTTRTIGLSSPYTFSPDKPTNSCQAGAKQTESARFGSDEGISANGTMSNLQRHRHLIANRIDERDSVQHHNASTCKRPLEQCRTTGIRDVDHATREGEPAGDSSQGTRGKAYCSARWLTHIVNSKESRGNRYRTSSDHGDAAPCSGSGRSGAKRRVIGHAVCKSRNWQSQRQNR